MKSFCKQNCQKCRDKDKCHGCIESDGCPFGKKCFIAKMIQEKGFEAYEKFVSDFLKDVNNLKIDDITHPIEDAYPLAGRLLNFQYEENGIIKKVLSDESIYLGNLVSFGSYYVGIAGNEKFIIVSKYNKTYSKVSLLKYYKRNIK